MGKAFCAHPRWIIPFLLWGALAWGRFAFGLDPHKAIAEYNYQVWTTKEGLPHDWVNSIVQTRDQHLWIGTSVGLVRFDGVRFALFNKSNAPGLSVRNTLRLQAGADGSLWIIPLFGNELSQWKHGEFKTFTTPLVAPHIRSRQIAGDHQGRLFCRTDAGVLAFKNEQFVKLDGNPDSQWDKALWADSTGDYQSKIVAGEDWKSLKIDPASVRKIISDKILVGAPFWGREESLWLPAKEGLIRIKDGELTSFPYEPFKTHEVVSIIQDREGCLWIAVPGVGIVRFQNGKYECFSSAQGLVDNNVTTLYEDHEGSIWIGTHGGGISRLKEVSFSAVALPPGLSEGITNVVFEDHLGQMWFGLTGGLIKFQNGTARRYTSRDGVHDNFTISIAETRDGSLWVGGRSTGLCRFQHGRFTKVNLPGLPHKVVGVTALYVDREDGLWIGTEDAGLFHLKDAQVSAITTCQGLSNNCVRSLCEDGQGNIWVGTQGGGLTQLQGGTVRTCFLGEGLSNNALTSLYADAEGTLWIGTAGGGLRQFKNGRFQSFTSKQGLFDDVIFTILEDGNNNLWMGSELGVFRVNKKDLATFALGRAPSFTCVAYDESDGLPSRSISGHTQPVGWKSRDGRLWFACIKGVVSVDPAHLMTDPIPPPVLIESVTINGKKFDPGRNAAVPPGEGDISFAYSGLSFRSPGKVRFKYRLEGYDAEWVEAGSRREAFYTNISPGSYRFRVMACNGDGIWNQEAASFDFSLKPRFYQAAWFYFCLTAAVLLALAGMHSLHVGQIKSRAAAVLTERGRIAREIHDTLLQGFAGISAQLNTISVRLFESPSLAKQQLDRLRIQVGQCMEEARRSIWNLQHENLDKNQFITTLKESLRSIADGQPLQTQLHVQGVPRQLPKLVVANTLQIAQEAIRNAVRHAQAHLLLVELTFQDQYLRLSVQDDGCGFETQRDYSSRGSFGLLSMQERARQIQSQLELRSAPGRGTDVTLVVCVEG